MPQDSPHASSGAPALGGLLTVGLLAGAVVAASLMGWLSRLGAHADFSGFAACLLLGAAGLGPLAFYAVTLERGKSAPALRSPLAPLVLFALLHVCVQASGGLESPLWGAYPLLVLLLARNGGIVGAAAVAVLATALEGFPVWMQAHASELQRAGEYPWPRSLALALPAVGLALGALSRRARAAAPTADGERAPARAPGSAPAAVPAPAPSLPVPPPPEGRSAAAQLDLDLAASLDLAFSSHPAFNALNLWWGSAEGVRLHHQRLRVGTPVAEAAVAPGDGHLGLVLRDRKVLCVEPLTANAAAGLPYAQGAYAARCLRVLPLSDEGSLVGLLACDKAGEDSFSPDEAAALDALARVLVRHAQRAAYADRQRTAGARFQKLYGASQELAKGLERDALLATFSALLPTLVPCDSWTLAMRDEDHAALQRIAGVGYAADAPRVLSLDRSGALAATLSQSDGAVLFNSQGGAQVPAALLEGLSGEPRNFLLAPLRLGGKLAGVLKLDRTVQPFTEEERDVAFIFANQAAGTLDRARLFTLHQRLATTDGLTGLYNHRFFQERLAVELERAQRMDRPLTVALTDIDFFKKFNDTFGHQEGDVVLRRSAELVQAGVRPGKDIVCRYGGEEFAVILPECDVVEARQILDALRADCAARLIGGSGPEARPIHLSVGLATFPAAAREQRDLIHAADEALYLAKHTGRNRVCSFKDLARPV